MDWWAWKKNWDKLFGESVTAHVAGEKLTHTSVEDLYTQTFGKWTLAYWRLR
jgi:hypothetical protein